MPEELEKVEGRLVSLGELRQALFEALNDAHIRRVEVTEDAVRFELGPFFNEGIRKSIELAISTGTQLAMRLESL